MRPASATTGEAFRLMLLVTAVLLAVFTIAGWLVYTSTTAALKTQIRAQISEDFGLMEDAHARAGEQGLVQFISWASATRSDQSVAFGMFAASGAHVSGVLAVAPTYRGWSDLSQQGAAAAQPGDQLAYAGQIGDHIVVVAHPDDIVTTTGNAVIEAFALAGIIVALTGLAAGYFTSRATSMKLHLLAQTLERVSGGDSDIRLPISTRNDHIDFVSREINSYLDRLAELMASMRNTAIAIAHDLKTPLNRVSILLQNAEAAQESDAVRNYLERAQDEMADLKSVLDTILRISRIEASDDTSAFATFDLPAMLKDLVQTFEPVLEEHQQTIRFIAPQTPVSPAFGDRRMLQQLIVNLIENCGRHAGPAALVEISVTEGAGAPIVTIADNGPGIPADQRDAVFAPFFRMNPERNELGTGLGLALVKAITTRHRASISLHDNAPGLLVQLTMMPRRIIEAAIT